MKKNLLVDMYKKMVEIRCFEEKVRDVYLRGLIRGTVHLSIGQEAVAAGVCTALFKDDYLTTTHRGHGHCIAKGAKVDRMLAEILGKRTGYCQGRGGSMHISDLATGNLSTNGIVGGGIPIAVGAALGIKLKKTKQIVVSFFGEGAANQGTFHEGINMAAIWKLPVIFVCENNLYSDTTPVRETTSIGNIADRGRAYGIPGEIVDGNDVAKVYEAMRNAADRARAGWGPTLIEAKTYRWEGHHPGDPCVYRTKEEVEKWKKKCPIKRCEAKIIKKGLSSKMELERIKDEAMKLVEKAEKFALESPDPSPDEALKNIFA